MTTLLRIAALSAGLAVFSPFSSAALAADAPAPGTPPAAPSADAVKEAETHFRRGVELYKEGDANSALVEFKRAYALAPNYRVLFNLGQTYFQLQRYADALRTLQAYLNEGGSQIPADKRASVEADVKQLANRVGQIDVKVSADGAQVLVDDEPVGTSPLAQSVSVSIGRRKVTATKAGLPTQDRFVDVAAGDHVPVTIEFPAPQAVAVAPAPVAQETPIPVPPPAAPPPEPSRTGMYVAWGITGALGAGAAVTGILTLAAKSDYTKDLGAFPGDKAQIDSASSKVKTLGIVTDALLIGTAVAGTVAIVLTATSSHSNKPSTEIGIGPTGIALRGRY